MCGWFSDKNHTEKIKPTFLIFSMRFSSPIEGPALIAIREGGSVLVVG